jgi:uncharacterized protein (TIGR03083 family)
MHTTEYLDALRDRSTALLGAARSDLEASVPSCPGWTVADLLTHTSRVWGWAATIVRTGARADFPEIPEGLAGAGLLGWSEEQARHLVESLEAADPGADCWTFGLPRSARFWFRRQALETAVHAWDAERAVAHAEPIEPELAADGVDEFLAVMLPGRVQGHSEAWHGESLHLHRTDGDGEWLVRLGPDGAATTEHAHGEADVALSGTASSLYLWCLSRVSAAELEVSGDRAVADRWTTEIAF